MAGSRATEVRARRLAAELGVEVRRYRDRATGPAVHIAVKEDPRMGWAYLEPSWEVVELFLIDIADKRRMEQKDLDPGARSAGLRPQVAELRAELAELEADLATAEQVATRDAALIGKARGR